MMGDGGATLSSCKTYRYHLWRDAGGRAGPLLFVLLNPSTADAKEDDPTILRCLERARRWGYTTLDVVNLFALRSTDPGALVTAADPVGPNNDAHILEAAVRATTVICGWGSNSPRPERAAEVLALLRRVGKTPMALKINADGNPAHPLYLSYDLEPIPMEGA